LDGNVNILMLRGKRFIKNGGTMRWRRKAQHYFKLNKNVRTRHRRQLSGFAAASLYSGSVHVRQIPAIAAGKRAYEGEGVRFQFPPKLIIICPVL